MNKITSFISQTREELRKVTWPNKQEVTRLTTVVIISSLVVGIYLSGLDYVFTKLLGVIIK